MYVDEISFRFEFKFLSSNFGDIFIGRWSSRVVIYSTYVIVRQNLSVSAASA